jgi:hypothetical protein
LLLGEFIFACAVVFIISWPIAFRDVEELSQPGANLALRQSRL